MPDRKMQLGARLICEFLHANPGSTRRQVAEGVEDSYKNIRDTISRLERSGYVKRDGGYDARILLTGKTFPASVDYRKTPVYVAAAKRAEADTFRRTPLDVVIYKMVRRSQLA